MSKHRKITLTTEERTSLTSIIRSGQTAARTQTRARILLLTDYSQGEQWTNDRIAEAMQVSKKTVANIRKRYLDEGMEATLYDKPRSGSPPKLTGEVEAQLTLLACSDPPEGVSKWTMRLLAEQLVELEVIESISHVAVWERLKKTTSSHGE